MDENASLVLETPYGTRVVPDGLEEKNIFLNNINNCIHIFLEVYLHLESNQNAKIKHSCFIILIESIYDKDKTYGM